MQGYGTAFARVYDQLWAGFAADIASRIRDYHTRTPLAATLDEPEREGHVFVVAGR